MNEEFDVQVKQIEELLRHVAFIIKKRGRDILSDFGITNPQFNALLVLDSHPDITMGELCERLYLACSTATDLIDRMEKNGLLERRRDPEDRRVIRLRTMPKAKEVIEQVIQARRRYVKSILTKLDEKDIETLARSLQQLHSLMTEENLPSQ
ncbi:MAG TPA: winged helix-turn-helix transcriptional regulator [Firmicutes bacterium]|nr:winged helix-turn-helix transcriptional regulator [Candidatus Fermentithermobacillaceae bacterium]